MTEPFSIFTVQYIDQTLDIANLNEIKTEEPRSWVLPSFQIEDRSDSLLQIYDMSKFDELD